MQEKNKKKKSILFKVIGSSSILLTAFVMTILICVLMIFDFFGTNLTKEKVQNNAEYADAYKNAVNNNLKNGYVPLQRILYFYLEDSSLSFDTLYKLNQNTEAKTTRDILSVCADERVKNNGACTESNILENEDYLNVPTGKFNFPLNKSFTVTSFYNQKRTVYGEENIHSGWDFATSAKTPVYSVCDGSVYKVNYTQDKNIPYDQSGNGVGNSITIKCDKDYMETYYVVYHHLYPKSSKVKVNEEVNHWTAIASVGTTGHSTGNHLHYQVYNSNWQLIDGMQLIDLNLTKSK